MKPVAYILILIFSFISIGTSLFFFSALSHIHSEMKEQVADDKNPQCLIFSNEDFTNLKWEEKKKEFRLNGKMYDVSAIEIEGDQVMVYCVFDKKETNLRKKLADLFTDKPGNHNPLRLWVKMLSQNYFTTPQYEMPVLHRSYILMQDYYFFKVHAFENEMADPPPRS
ncbi:MAG: hypothetical protein IH595_12840 [Bacteroidales bacterium]|nr:hypothetical protein [Bacteroidales bacterium]